MKLHGKSKRRHYCFSPLTGMLVLSCVAAFFYWGRILIPFLRHTTGSSHHHHHPAASKKKVTANTGDVPVGSYTPPLREPWKNRAAIKPRDFSPSAFLDMPSRTVDGWLDYEDLYVVQLLSKEQHNAGLMGAVGEIGVHHGLLFIGLVLSAAEQERLWAADVFERQHLNLDQSGHGNEGIFLNNVKQYTGVEARDVTLFKGSSLDLKAEHMRNKLTNTKTRLFSVDGCHTYECTLNDLQLAHQVILEEGGIVLLDDFAQTNPEIDETSNPFVKGVSTAALAFLKRQQELHNVTLVPFFATANKLYLTSPGEYVDRYTKAIQQSSLNKCIKGEMSLAGIQFFKMDWNRRTHFNDVCAAVQPGCVPCITRQELHAVFS